MFHASYNVQIYLCSVGFQMICNRLGLNVSKGVFFRRVVL